MLWLSLLAGLAGASRQLRRELPARRANLQLLSFLFDISIPPILHVVHSDRETTCESAPSIAFIKSL